jgi:hypothetical protein
LAGISVSHAEVAFDISTDEPPEQQLRARANGPFKRWHLPDQTEWASFFHLPRGGFLVCFPSLCDYAVLEGGRVVTAYPRPGTANDTAIHIYLNQVLPLALSELGKLVLHASALEVGTSAIALLGTSGLGKSTLTASFSTAGYRFLTDDGLVVESATSSLSGRPSFRALPSHPYLRLWADSQNALVHADANVGPAVQYTKKSRILSDDKLTHCDTPRSLRCMYFLGQATTDTICIESVDAASAMLQLVRHSFLLDTENAAKTARHFQMVAELAEGLPFFSLSYPRRFDELPAVRAAVIDHLSSL